MKLPGRWQVHIFEVVAIGLWFGLKHISLLVREQQNPAQESLGKKNWEITTSNT